MTVCTLFKSHAYERALFKLAPLCCLGGSQYCSAAVSQLSWGKVVPDRTAKVAIIHSLIYIGANIFSPCIAGSGLYVYCTGRFVSLFRVAGSLSTTIAKLYSYTYRGTLWKCKSCSCLQRLWVYQIDRKKLMLQWQLALSFDFVFITYFVLDM